MRETIMSIYEVPEGIIVLSRVCGEKPSSEGRFLHMEFDFTGHLQLSTDPQPDGTQD
jgi:hypothetical protein